MRNPKIDMKILEKNIYWAHTGPESAFCQKKQKNINFQYFYQIYLFEMIFFVFFELLKWNGVSYKRTNTYKSILISQYPSSGPVSSIKYNFLSYVSYSMEIRTLIT